MDDKIRFRPKFSTDQWSVRERLALASSVVKSGDQNWVSVSRAVRPFGAPNRPADWFSQKNCATQYSDLLEKVETPKRKRGEREGVETPGDLILRKLANERIEELKRTIEAERVEYEKIRNELDLVKSGQMDDQVKEMWERLQESKAAAAVEEARRLAEETSVREQAKASAARLKRSQSIPSTSSSPHIAWTVPPTLSEPEDNTQDSLIDTIVNEDSNPSLPTVCPPPTGVNESGGVTRMGHTPSLTVSESLAVDSEELLRLEDMDDQAMLFDGPEIHTDIGVSCIETEIVSESMEEVDIKQEPASIEAPASANEEVCEEGMEGGQQSDSSEHLPPPTQPPPPAAPAVKEELIEEDSRLTTCTLNTDETEIKSEELAVVSKMEDEEEEEEEVYMEEEVVEEIDSSDPAVDVHDMTTSTCVDVKTSLDSPSDVDLGSPDPPPVTENKKVSRRRVSDVVEPPLSVSGDGVESCVIEHCEVVELTTQTVSTPLLGYVVYSDEKGGKWLEGSGDGKSTDFSLKSLVSGGASVETGGPVEDEESTKENLIDAMSPASSIISIETTGSVQGSVRGGSRARGRKGKGSSLVGSRGSSRARHSAEDAKESEVSSKPSEAETSDDDGSRSHAPLDTDDLSFSLPPKLRSDMNESLPNSPASVSHGSDNEDEKHHRIWKRSIMLVWRSIANHKYANTFLHPVTEDIAPGYHSIVLRPMDLTTIRKNIDIGVTRSTAEFQRDIMLVFTNAIMYNSDGHDVHLRARHMYQDVMMQIEQFVNTQAMMLEPKSSIRALRRLEPGHSDKEEDKKRHNSELDLSVLNNSATPTASAAVSAAVAADKPESVSKKRKQPPAHLRFYETTT